MYAFKYAKAKSVADAAASIAADPDAKLLAGGQSLIAAMKLRLSQPSALVDLGAISELRYTRVEGDALVVGAMSTHAFVAACADVNKAIPALAALAGDIGDRQVRNMGTIGGSIATNDPAADYPAGCVGLGATIVTTQRRIAADDFFGSMYETALEPGEIITSVSFPIPKRAAYIKFPNPASRYAMAGAFVARHAGGVRVAITGAGSCVFRARDFEAALARDFRPEAIAGIALDDSHMIADMHGSAAYRAHLAGVVARRAVAACMG